jgi:hypothetical protein
MSCRVEIKTYLSIGKRIVKIEQAIQGVKVQTHPDGPVLTIKYAWGRYVALELINENGTREDMGMCPITMLDTYEG